MKTNTAPRTILSFVQTPGVERPPSALPVPAFPTRPLGPVVRRISAEAPLLRRSRSDNDRDLTRDALKLAELGNAADAERVLRSAIDLNPRDPVWHYTLAKILLQDGRPAEAIAAAQEARARGLPGVLANDIIAKGLLLQGKPDEAFATLMINRKRKVRTLFMVMHVLRRPFNYRVEDVPGDLYPARDMAEFYAFRGDKAKGDADRVFAWLDQATASGDYLEVNRLLRSPFIAPIRDDPRWTAVLERWNLKREDLAAFRLDATVFAQRPAEAGADEAAGTAAGTTASAQMEAVAPMERRGQLIVHLPKER